MAELVHFGNVSGADDDVKRLVEVAGDANGSAADGGVGDDNHQRPRVLDLHMLEQSGAGAVSQDDRLGLSAFVSNGEGIHFDDDVG